MEIQKQIKTVGLTETGSSSPEVKDIQKKVLYDGHSVTVGMQISNSSLAENTEIIGKIKLVKQEPENIADAPPVKGRASIKTDESLHIPIPQPLVLDGTVEKTKHEMIGESNLRPSQFFGTKTQILQNSTQTSQSIIPKEKEPELIPILENMKSYLEGKKDVEIKGVYAEVLDILEGRKTPDNLSVDTTNCNDYLQAAKLWDKAMADNNKQKNLQKTEKTYGSFATSSYELRTHLAMKGNLPSNQAYTKTLDPKQYNNWDHIEIQSNWIPERAGLHTKIIETNLVKALALSKRLDTDRPSVWAVRGNTGAGKSYSIKNDEKFSRAMDENGEPSGAINPDTFKGALKKANPVLSHAQLHMEGSGLSYQFAQALSKEAVKATLIIDTRLAKHSDLKSSVLDSAKIRGGDAMLLDIEAPPLTSINRVFTRSPNGDDPIVPLWAIKDGYEQIRGERSQILNEVKGNDSIKYYKFYITDETGNQKLAAKKENGIFEIIPGMEEAVAKAQQKPEADEFNTLVNQVIDDNYIKNAKEIDHIPSSKLDMIKKWKGYTVKTALEKHSRGESP